MDRILWRKQEDGFRIIEFGGDRLHLVRAEPFRLQHDGEGIPAETSSGEDVYGAIGPCHERSSPGCFP